MCVPRGPGSSSIVNAFEAGSLPVYPVQPDTIAKSIAIGNPADGYYALMVARQSGGGAASATDDELIEGVKLLAQTEGIFAEAAGGVVIAGLKKLVAKGMIKENEVTVAFITGAGPRTQEVISDIVQPLAIQPTLKSFEKVVGDQA